MKFRSIFTAVAVSLVSIVSVFAQSNLKEMTKVVPPDAVIAAYGNSKKITSSKFMQGLLDMMKNNPAFKDKCAEIEAELQKGSDGECIFGISVDVNPKNPSDRKVTICGLVKSGSLAAQWDSNIQSLKKEKKLTVQQGEYNGMDYVSLRMDEPAKTTGYALKLDKTTAYFTVLYPDDSKEFMKPALPVFYKEPAAFVQKLDSSAYLSVAIDIDAIKNMIGKIWPGERASIPPELEGMHNAVISFTEKDHRPLPLLQFVMQVYADEKALVFTQNTINEALAEAKKGQSSFTELLNMAKVTKKDDHISLTLSVPSQLLLGLIEMHLLAEGQTGEDADIIEQPEEEGSFPAVKENPAPAVKK